MTCPSEAPQGPLLQVINNPAAIREDGEPVAQGGRLCGAEQGQHHAFASERLLVAGHVGGEERDRSASEVAVGDGVSRTVGPVELGECVQLDFATEDIAIEGQGLASSSGEMKVGRRVGHAPQATQCGQSRLVRLARIRRHDVAAVAVEGRRSFEGRIGA